MDVSPAEMWRKRGALDDYCLAMSSDDLGSAGEPSSRKRGFSVEDYVCQIEQDGAALAVAARAAGLDAPVPSCPGWSVRHLLAHIGFVHRWAAAHVANASPDPGEDPGEDEIFDRRPGDDELLAWYEDGCEGLARTLRGAPPDVVCWTFMAAPSPLAFWARRQAHETAMHRVDAELSTGGMIAPFSQEFAADGLDELLCGFAPRKRLAQEGASRPWSLGVRAEETGQCWTVAVGPQAVTATRALSEANCVVSGPAQLLYLLLWNRLGADARSLRVEGVPSVLGRWASLMRMNW